MNREQCTVGMKVYFGRENGQVTEGVIVKINGKKAKVKTTEARGKFPVGAVWSVPYSLLETTSGGTAPAPVKKVEPLVYSPFQDRVEQQILEAINSVYNGLSPENLTCDGEAPRHMVEARRRKLNQQLKGLFIAFGREVDENEAFEWWRSKQDYKNNLQKV